MWIGFPTTQNCRRQKIWSLNTLIALVQFTPPRQTRHRLDCFVVSGGRCKLGIIWVTREPAHSSAIFWFDARCNRLLWVLFCLIYCNIVLCIVCKCLYAYFDCEYANWIVNLSIKFALMLFALICIFRRDALHISSVDRIWATLTILLSAWRYHRLIFSDFVFHKSYNCKVDLYINNKVYICCYMVVLNRTTS